MEIAVRNRLIKKVLTAEFGPGTVTVRGSRGTAYGWVSVNVNVRPKDRDERETFKAKVWDLFAKHEIKIGSYGTPGDMGADYGWGNKIHLDFAPCLDEFETGERVAWNGRTGTIKDRPYNRGGDWYLVAWDGAEATEEFSKRDLTRIANAGGAA